MIVGHADALRTALHGPLNADQLRSVDAILAASARLQWELEALAESLGTDGESGNS